MTSDESVAFGTPKRVGQDFVRNAVQSIVEVLVATTSSDSSARVARVQRPASNGTRAADN